MGPAWHLTNVRVADNAPLQSLSITGNAITAKPAPNATVWDAQGRVILRGFVDLHTHLDKTFVDAPNASGTLLEAIHSYNTARATLTPKNYADRMQRALGMAHRHGVTAIRSHINVLDAHDLGALEAMLQVRNAWRDKLDLQFVALGEPTHSPARLDAMHAALQMGCDLVGGAPSLMPDPAAAVAATFDLAEQHNKPIDLHLDESEDPMMNMLAETARQAIARGHIGRVTTGHCVSLSFMDDAQAAATIDLVAQAGISVITLPSCNLVLMGRGRTPAPRGITRVKQLLARGVNVCAASDNVGDPFNPFGNYDALQMANLTAHTAHMTGDAELMTCIDMVTANPARAFGQPTTLIVGAPADFVIVDATRVRDAITQVPARVAVFKQGVATWI